MDTLQCAVLLAKLERFPWELERRKALGARYNRLMDEAGLERVHQRQDRSSVFAQYTFFTENRDGIRARLQSLGIPTAVHYPVPLNRQPAYAHLLGENLTPNSDWAAARVLSLPMSADLREEQQDRIVRAVLEAL
jgi:UDP-2-acetamido-2-deoxy-ribo-hexuluronate aminotransferase